MFSHGWRDRSGNVTFNKNGERSGWLLVRGAKLDRKSDFDQIKSSIDRFSLLAGSDLAGFSTNDTDDIRLGLFVGYGSQEGDSFSSITNQNAASQLNGFNVGGYATWLQNGVNERGAYVDAVASFSRFDADVTQEQFGKSSYKINGFGLSLETGYSFDLTSTEDYNIWIEPQAQIGWTKLSGGDFSDASNTNISHSGNYAYLRLGARAGIESADKRNNGFFQVDYLNILASPKVGLGNYTAQYPSNDAVKLSFGVEHRLSDTVNLSGAIAYTSEFGSSINDLSGNVGLKVRF